MDGKYGAAIERGTIQKAEGGKYTVKSLTRDGIVTPPIPALPLMQGTENGYEAISYAAGDRVYFFLFEDGNGMILAAF